MEKWKLWFRIDQISLSDWDDWVIERLRCLYRDSQSDHYQPDHVSSSLSTELKIKTEFKSKVRLKIILLISPVNVTNVEYLNVKHTHYTLLYRQQCQSLKPCIFPKKARTFEAWILQHISLWTLTLHAGREFMLWIGRVAGVIAAVNVNTQIQTHKYTNT